MSEERTEDRDELEEEELERASGEPLPDREAMSILLPPTDSINPLPTAFPDGPADA